MPETAPPAEADAAHWRTVRREPVPPEVKTHTERDGEGEAAGVKNSTEAIPRRALAKTETTGTDSGAAARARATRKQSVEQAADAACRQRLPSADDDGERENPCLAAAFA